MLAALDFISLVIHHFQKIVKICRIFVQTIQDIFSDSVTHTWTFRVCGSFLPLARFCLWNDRQSMFQTDNVTQSLKGDCGKPKIPELPVTIQIGGIKNDMIVNMCPVRMGRDNKSVLALCKSHAGFISYLIGFLRCNFSRFEGLANLIGNDISFGLPPRLMQIFFFALCKFQIHEIRIAFVRRNIFSVFRLFSVLRIFSSVLQTFCHTHPFVLMHCNQSCRRHSITCLT